MDADADVPVGHRGGPPLYGRMMAAIRRGHSVGNTIRMLKLPLIFCEERLYADAIAQFFALSAALETALERHATDPMVAKVRELGLRVTPGYESDLAELYSRDGCTDWRQRANDSLTTATRRYVQIVETSSPVELVSAAFILYGALVVGGGKATQVKVSKIFPNCKHALFDVAEDIKDARRRFKACFTEIGKSWPEHFGELEADAARFMGLNNTVVLSIRCVGRRVGSVARGVGVAGLVTMWLLKGRKAP